MKILLIGEYSRLHNSLKEGLVALGHEVTIVGFGDYFKNFPVDVKLELNYQTNPFKLFRKIYFKLFKTDLESLNIQRQFNTIKDELSNYDVVQLINENAFNTIPKVEKKLLDFIFKTNKNVFLLSCGTDTTSVNFALKNGFKYSILTPYFEKLESKKSYTYALKYTQETYKNLSKYIIKNCKGIIASDLDYHIPLQGHPKYSGMVPNPINTDILAYNPLKIEGKIILFHGINSSKYYKKGNHLFSAALTRIQKKHQNKIEIITVKDLPYSEYIESFNKAHIILDQVYAYDQGYNALEAMAKGKVVFTGAEQEWLEHFNLEEDTVAINALPDVDNLVKKLEWLILNPEQIIAISKNARQFIETQHYYINSAKMYLDLWQRKSDSIH